MEVILFHHAHGLTQGVVAFADVLRRHGHVVHAPDLYEGRMFASLKDGISYARSVGFGQIMARGTAAVNELSRDVVYAGFSLGVMPAQMLTQTRAGARGALLFHGCLPVSEFGAHWPAGVPVQVHAMERDPFFVDDGDLDAARALVKDSPDAALFLYDGDQHLFADGSLESYDANAANLLLARAVAFLEACGSRPEPQRS